MTRIPILLGPFLAACATAGLPIDAPDVYRIGVRLPRSLTDAQPVWVDGPLKALPRQGLRPPAVGDYALYVVGATQEPGGYSGSAPRCALYLMLETVANVDPGFIEIRIRLFGASWDRDGSLVHKGLTIAREPLRRHEPLAESWPSGFLGSWDGSTLSLADLDYFRPYDALKGVEVRAVADHPLPRGEWGGPRIFGVSFVVSHGVYAGREHLILSDRGPVRGLLHARTEVASSSGLRHRKEEITLVNHGRLSPRDAAALADGDDALPSERALWEAFAR